MLGSTLLFSRFMCDDACCTLRLTILWGNLFPFPVTGASSFVCVGTPHVCDQAGVVWGRDCQKVVVCEYDPNVALVAMSCRKASFAALCTALNLKALGVSLGPMVYATEYR